MSEPTAEGTAEGWRQPSGDEMHELAGPVAAALMFDVGWRLGQISDEIGRSDSLETALDRVEKCGGVLPAVIAIKDARITVLEGQLPSAPKRRRLSLSLLGLTAQ